MAGRSHKFDPARLAYLESDDRRSILDPRKLLPRLGIQKGWIVIDVGCGPGFFSFPLAGMVGPHGRVYGIDMEPLMIQTLEKRISERRVKNVVPILSNESFIPLPNAIADFALMATVLHELEGAGTLRESARILKRTGTLGVIDWKKIEESIGPPLEHRLSEGEAAIMLKAAGFDPGKAMNLGPSHYGFIARKS